MHTNQHPWLRRSAPGHRTAHLDIGAAQGAGVLAVAAAGAVCRAAAGPWARQRRRPNVDPPPPQAAGADAPPVHRRRQRLPHLGDWDAGAVTAGRAPEHERNVDLR